MYSGYGGTLSFSDIAAISNIISIAWTGVDGETIVLKTLADVNRFCTKMAGGQDAGELSVVCAYDATQFNTLMTNGNSTTNVVVTHTLPDGSTIVCNGFYKKPGALDLNTDPNVVQYTFVVPLSGEPTFTAA